MELSSMLKNLKWQVFQNDQTSRRDYYTFFDHGLKCSHKQERSQSRLVLVKRGSDYQSFLLKNKKSLITYPFRESHF